MNDINDIVNDSFQSYRISMSGVVPTDSIPDETLKMFFNQGFIEGVKFTKSLYIPKPKVKRKKLTK